MWFETADITRGASFYRAKCLHTQTFCCQFFHIIIITVVIIIIIIIIQSLKYFAQRCEKSESFLAHSMVAGWWWLWCSCSPLRLWEEVQLREVSFLGSVLWWKGCCHLCWAEDMEELWTSNHFIWPFIFLTCHPLKTKHKMSQSSLLSSLQAKAYLSHVSVCPELCSQISIGGSLSTTPPWIHQSGSPASITSMQIQKWHSPESINKLFLNYLAC